MALRSAPLELGPEAIRETRERVQRSVPYICAQASTGKVKSDASAEEVRPEDTTANLRGDISVGVRNTLPATWRIRSYRRPTCSPGTSALKSLKRRGGVVLLLRRGERLPCAWRRGVDPRGPVLARKRRRRSSVPPRFLLRRRSCSTNAGTRTAEDPARRRLPRSCTPRRRGRASWRPRLADPVSSRDGPAPASHGHVRPERGGRRSARPRTPCRPQGRAAGGQVEVVDARFAMEWRPLGPPLRADPFRSAGMSALALRALPSRPPRPPRTDGPGGSKGRPPVTLFSLADRLPPARFAPPLPATRRPPVGDADAVGHSAGDLRLQHGSYHPASANQGEPHGRIAGFGPYDTASDWGAVRPGFLSAP